VNILGFQVTTKASGVLMAIMTACALLFVILAAHWIITQGGFGALFDGTALFNPQSFAIRPLMAGAGIAALSYIGFDAISTLAEDSVNPEKELGFATVMVCVLQTLICCLTVYLAAIVWPDYKSFQDPETLILDIGRRVGGTPMFHGLTLTLLVAGLASALTGQAGASRLLYGMGRDGLLSKRLFGHIDRRFSTPIRSIYFMSALSIVGIFLMRFEIAVELLNFGAFAGFILVNLSVIRYYYVDLRRRRGWQAMNYLVFPTGGTLACTYLWMSLSVNARLAGFLWVGVGAIYLAVITRGFREQPKPLTAVGESP
jgi:amino acid transporter